MGGGWGRREREGGREREQGEGKREGKRGGGEKERGGRERERGSDLTFLFFVFCCFVGGLNGVVGGGLCWLGVHPFILVRLEVVMVLGFVFLSVLRCCCWWMMM